MELFDVSLWAAPVGLAFAIGASIVSRTGWPLVGAGLGGLLGGVVGRVAWGWFAEKVVGFDLGSEFEGYDWVVGFASVGVLFGALLGATFAVRRRNRRAHSRSASGRAT